MIQSGLDQRASLAVWPPDQPGGAVSSEEFLTLREALHAAAGLLSDPEKRPWIVTEEGAILRPGWIREQARMLGLID